MYIWMIVFLKIGLGAVDVRVKSSGKNNDIQKTIEEEDEWSVFDVSTKLILLIITYQYNEDDFRIEFWFLLSF